MRSVFASDGVTDGDTVGVDVGIAGLLGGNSVVTVGLGDGDGEGVGLTSYAHTSPHISPIAAIPAKRIILMREFPCRLIMSRHVP